MMINILFPVYTSFTNINNDILINLNEMPGELFKSRCNVLLLLHTHIHTHTHTDVALVMIMLTRPQILW